MRIFTVFRLAVILAIVSVLVVADAKAATFEVNSTGDAGDTDLGDGLCQTASGECTLRAAIEQANALPGLDTVNFEILACASAPCTITPALPLPPVTDPILMDGYSQTGASENTNPIDQPINAALRVTLDGAYAFAGNGLTIRHSAVVKGLVIGRFIGHGIHIESGVNVVTVQGNFVGLGADGSFRRNSGDGIRITGSPGNLIGGLMPAHRNLISANSQEGIEVNGGAATGNVIQGNFIGTDASGLLDRGNGYRGILIWAASQTQIGGTIAPARNVIAGNGLSNIGLYLNASTPAIIQGNYLGVGRDGSTVLGGSTGVWISSGRHVIGGSEGVTPGGACTGACNVISGNDVGIFANLSNGTTIQGNFIGPDATGTRPVRVGVCCPDGIWLRNFATNFQIGGSAPGEGNLISGLSGEAIRFSLLATANSIQGNRVGTRTDGISALGNGTGILLTNDDPVTGVEDRFPVDNTITGNIIAFNAENGVRVVGSGTIRNRVANNSIHTNGFRGIENRNGGNRELAPPAISSAAPTAASGTACPFCTVEVFSDANGEGEKLEAITSADEAGHWSAAGVFGGPNITATAIDTDGSTSEFPNLRPVAVDDTAATTLNRSVTFSVLLNDSDPDGDALVIIAFNGGTNGSVSLNADRTLTYVPVCGFSGTETFTYTIDDGNGGVDIGSVTVAVMKERPADPGPPDSRCEPR